MEISDEMRRDLIKELQEVIIWRESHRIDSSNAKDLKWRLENEKGK